MLLSSAVRVGVLLCLSFGSVCLGLRLPLGFAPLPGFLYLLPLFLLRCRCALLSYLGLLIALSLHSPALISAAFAVLVAASVPST
jgi:hypothetical protein